jgi:hypothetical protein
VEEGGAEVFPEDLVGLLVRWQASEVIEGGREVWKHPGTIMIHMRS